MVRLLRRAKDRPADPDLYAGLTHACRYCGLIAASIAATEQARRLDPRIRTSGAHSHFMIGDYERVLDFQEGGVPYMRSLALLMLGREAEARASLASLDLNTPGRLPVFGRALLHDLEGRREEAMSLLSQQVDIPDPEGCFYLARGMAHLGYADQALGVLAKCVEDGFFCLAGYTRDPWLDPLRGTPQFGALLRRAEARHRQALISFLNAEGDRILGVAHPV